jgi:hypothetical protein
MSRVQSFCIPNGTYEDYNGEVLDVISISGYSAPYPPFRSNPLESEYF